MLSLCYQEEREKEKERANKPQVTSSLDLFLKASVFLERRVGRSTHSTYTFLRKGPFSWIIRMKEMHFSNGYIKQYNPITIKPDEL